MKTRSRWFHLRGLFLLSLGLTLGSALCASAVAGPSSTRDLTTNREQTTQQKPAPKKVEYYILSSASAIPKPLAWINATFPTTAIPIQIIGRSETIYR